MGQNCIGIERIIVHTSQFDELYEIFKDRVSKMRVGSVMRTGQADYIATIDGGSMISNNRFRGLERLVHDATEAGAYVIGGEEFKHPIHEEGFYFRPTVVGLTNVTDIEIMQHEGQYYELLNFRRVTQAFTSFCANCIINPLRQRRRSNRDRQRNSIWPRRKRFWP